MRHGHRCVVFDRLAEPVQKLVGEGAAGAADLKGLVAQLEKPRAVWLMLPAGDVTEAAVIELGALMEAGDIAIDGGNSFYQDDIRRAKALGPKGIHYVDVGTSGGIWGIERGYCMMIGGDRATVEHLDPIFQALAPGNAGIPPTPGRHSAASTAEQGYLYCGPSGAGHFVKMIHNGIEYGIMQAYAEGFDILKSAAIAEVDEARRYKLNLADIAEVWRRGSVIGSWLLDLTAMALAEDAELSRYSGFVQDSGEGRWTIMTAIEEAVPAEVLSAALYARFRSRQTNTFADKLLSAMREKFGGHHEPKAGT
jgi:6-phosphogluconate dehydrogenase